MTPITVVQSLHHVAVIGAGASGLAAARVLSRNGMVPVVLEKQLAGGGVWDYQKESQQSSQQQSSSSTQQNKKTTPMYRGLRTNLPREIMAYREKPWVTPATVDDETETETSTSSSSYVTHEQVLEYLNDYKKDYDLDRFIHYGSTVTQLTVLETTETTPASNIKLGSEPLPKIRLEWESSTGSGDDQEIQKHSDIFDAVCIANGHYALPSVPALPGLDEYFKGTVLHSIAYDSPADFTGQTVLCIGGRASGSDLARELSAHCPHVYLSDATAYTNAATGGGASESTTTTQGNVTVVPKTQSVQPDGSITFFNDDSQQQQHQKVDTIIFCTGYEYQFPFITQTSNLDLTVGNRRVMPLVQQLWHADVPNLTFLGLPHSVIPFPLFELQTEAIVGQLLLLEEEESVVGNDENDDSFVLNTQTKKSRHDQAQHDAVAGGSQATGQIKDTHFLGNAQWDYLRQMAKAAHLYDEEMEQFIQTNKAIYDHAGNERKTIFPGGADVYRSTRYKRRDDTRLFDVLSSECEAAAAPAAQS